MQVNPALCRMLAYTREEFIQLSPSDYIHQDSLYLLADYNKALANGEEFYCHGVDIRKDGSLLDVEVKGTVCIYNGKPHGLAVIRDISEKIHVARERKRAEEALRKQLKRSQLLHRLTSQIRKSLDFNTVLSSVVEEIREFLQIDRCNFGWYYYEASDPYWEIVCESCDAELPGLKGRYPASAFGTLTETLLRLEVFRVDDVELCSDRVFQQAALAYNNKSALCIPMQMNSGVVGVISCIQHQSIRPWADEEIEFLQLVMEQLAIALNQAQLYKQTQIRAQELEQTLQELQRTQTQIIQSEKMSSLGQMVAGVAHEINNPVNFIHGNIDYLSEYIEDLLGLLQLYQQHYPNPVIEIARKIEEIELEFLQQDIAKIKKSMKFGTERIRDIVKSLRTFSRLDEAECKMADIHEGIDSTLMILENRLKAKSESPGIAIFKDYGKLPLVECYAGQLNQVFMNILVNAIDALEERHKNLDIEEIKQNPSAIYITTEVVELEKSVIITIRDNALGIPESIQNRIFDPFFTTKAIGKGTGLGMSISYQIITQKHLGTLKCVSSPGKGTTFTIKIPITQ